MSTFRVKEKKSRKGVKTQEEDWSQRRDQYVFNIQKTSRESKVMKRRLKGEQPDSALDPTESKISKEEREKLMHELKTRIKSFTHKDPKIRLETATWLKTALERYPQMIHPLMKITDFLECVMAMLREPKQLSHEMQHALMHIVNEVASSHELSFSRRLTQLKFIPTLMPYMDHPDFELQSKVILVLGNYAVSSCVERSLVLQSDLHLKIMAIEAQSFFKTSVPDSFLEIIAWLVNGLCRDDVPSPPVERLYLWLPLKKMQLNEGLVQLFGFY